MTEVNKIQTDYEAHIIGKLSNYTGMMTDIFRPTEENKLTQEKQDNIFAQTNYDLTDNSTGKKYDTGKPMVGTLARVFPNALMAIGECIEFGTHKYPDPNNWKKVEGAKTRYLDSLMRHLLKHYMGITGDEETGLPHLAHAAWNALAILELELMDRKQKID